MFRHSAWEPLSDAGLQNTYHTYLCTLTIGRCWSAERVSLLQPLIHRCWSAERVSLLQPFTDAGLQNTYHCFNHWPMLVCRTRIIASTIDRCWSAECVSLLVRFSGGMKVRKQHRPTARHGQRMKSHLQGKPQQLGTEMRRPPWKVTTRNAFSKDTKINVVWMPLHTHACFAVQHRVWRRPSRTYMSQASVPTQKICCAK